MKYKSERKKFKEDQPLLQAFKARGPKWRGHYVSAKVSIMIFDDHDFSGTATSLGKKGKRSFRPTFYSLSSICLGLPCSVSDH